MENHLKFSAGSHHLFHEMPPTSLEWAGSRLREVAFSAAVGRLLHLLRHPFDQEPGHAIGGTFLEASNWSAPPLVSHHEMHEYQQTWQAGLRSHILSMTAALETNSGRHIPYSQGRHYEAMLMHQLEMAPHMPSDTRLSPSTLLPPMSLEKSIDDLAWASHKVTVRQSRAIILHGIVDLVQSGQTALANEYLDQLHLASSQQLLLSQQLRVDARLLSGEGLPRDGRLPELSDEGRRWLANIGPYTEKITAFMQVRPGQLPIPVSHPLDKQLQQYLLTARTPATMLAESQERLEIYQSLRTACDTLRPLCAAHDTSPSPAVDANPSRVNQLLFWYNYLDNARKTEGALAGLPPPVRLLVVSGLTHAQTLDQSRQAATQAPARDRHLVSDATSAPPSPSSSGRFPPLSNPGLRS